MSRLWLYAGLAAAGVGVARVLSTPKRLVPGETRLLLLGDSLAEGLAPPLRALAQDERIAFEVRAVRGTRIDQWATSQKIPDVLARFRPTLILVSLGTNDEYLRGEDAAARQRPAAEALWRVLDAAGAHVVWVGPPMLPKPSNGVRAMLRGVVPSRAYYPSDELAIPRGPDGIHPTPRGYAGWAGAVWRWL